MKITEAKIRELVREILKDSSKRKLFKEMSEPQKRKVKRYIDKNG
jgi:hypothetical protein